MKLGSKTCVITTSTAKAINALTELEQRPERKRRLRADQTHCCRCLMADMCSLKPQPKKPGYSKNWRPTSMNASTKRKLGCRLKRSKESYFVTTQSFPQPK